MKYILYNLLFFILISSCEKTVESNNYSIYYSATIIDDSTNLAIDSTELKLFYKLNSTWSWSKWADYELVDTDTTTTSSKENLSFSTSSGYHHYIIQVSCLKYIQDSSTTYNQSQYHYREIELEPGHYTDQIIYLTQN